VRNFVNMLNLLVSSLRLKALRRSQCVAALAIAGLYMQLAAGAFCTAGLTGPDLSGFPICHSGIADNSPGSHPQPLQQHTCPFCALHCHAALLLPPALHFAEPTAVAAVQQPVQNVSHIALRFAIAAQPRGPPHLS
jgi:hypothetical protein